MTGSGLGPGSWRAAQRVIGLALVGALIVTEKAQAQNASADGAKRLLFGFSDPDLYGSAGIAIFLGVVVFATVTAILYIRERNRWAHSKAESAAEIARLSAKADQAELLLGAEPQFVVAFAGDAEPEISGDVARITSGATGRRALAFGAWLAPDSARAIDHALAQLKARGDAFLLILRTNRDGVVEAEGRAIAGRAVLRIRDVGPERAERLRVEEKLAETKRSLAAAHALLDAMPHPVWLKDQKRRIVYANPAYIQAVEAPNMAAVLAKGLDVIDARQRIAAERVLDDGQVYRARAPAVVSGRRAVLDVVETIGEHGGGGIAVDMTELDELRADLERQMQSHVGTLDQLPTGVAMFDQSQKLIFHNQAYRELWGIDLDFLATAPRDGEILEHLRALRRLPEQANFQEWKRQILDAYRSLESRETWWHLPDGRTMRVVTRANPQGGVTYLFDDVSERFELQSKYNELMKVRRETLDALKEGVFVFGSDGRVKLFNKAVAKLWKLPKQVLKLKPHIDEVARIARYLAPDDEFWSEITGAVAGVTDMRTAFRARVTRRDDVVLDCTAAPLPDGATLVTFTDVSASVRAERALQERNEALERAGRLRNEFVHHVSYELRSPLTNVIGFAQWLDDPKVGPLTARQAEYVEHIKRSSTALLAIINDILDLQTIDSGELALDYQTIDIRDIVATVREGVADRLIEAKVDLVSDIDGAVQPFRADGKRLRQVLFKLVSNAIGFSKAGQRVMIRARDEGACVAILVEDNGRGIPDEIKAKVFEPFESHTKGSKHHGVGLGLAIVRAFVEAHGGRVELQSRLGEGTIVTCTLPKEPPTKPAEKPGHDQNINAQPARPSDIVEH